MPAGRNTPTISISTLALLLCSGFQDSQIRVEVEAVNLLVAVADRAGRFVTELTVDHFEIREDGERQEITHFSHRTELPLRLALLMDTSSSIRLQLDFEKQAATRFLYAVMRPRDEALLVEFDSGVSLLHDFTGRPRAIVERIEKLRAGGGTALIDALVSVTREKMTRSEARQAIVLLSDGRDLNSRHTLQEALQMMHRAGVIVYAVSTTRFAADQDQKGEKLLQELAENTGGRVFFPYSAERLEVAFDRINEELRSQYSLTYVPRNKRRDGKFRRIEVKVSAMPDLLVRHRKGYFASLEPRPE